MLHLKTTALISTVVVALSLSACSPGTKELKASAVEVEFPDKWVLASQTVDSSNPALERIYLAPAVDAEKEPVDTDAQIRSTLSDQDFEITEERPVDDQAKGRMLFQPKWEGFLPAADGIEINIGSVRTVIDRAEHDEITTGDLCKLVPKAADLCTDYGPESVLVIPVTIYGPDRAPDESGDDSNLPLPKPTN